MEKEIYEKLKEIKGMIQECLDEYDMDDDDSDEEEKPKKKAKKGKKDMEGLLLMVEGKKGKKE